MKKLTLKNNLIYQHAKKSVLEFIIRNPSSLSNPLLLNCSISGHSSSLFLQPNNSKSSCLNESLRSNSWAMASANKKHRLCIRPFRKLMTNECWDDKVKVTKVELSYVSCAALIQLFYTLECCWSEITGFHTIFFCLGPLLHLRAGIMKCAPERNQESVGNEHQSLSCWESERHTTSDARICGRQNDGL